MALRWIEGFETHRAAPQLARKYSTASGTYVSAAGRVLGNSCQLNACAMVTKSFGVGNVWIIGFALFVPANFTASTNGVYIEKASAEQCHIGFSNSAGFFNLTFQRGATVLGTTTSNFLYNVWHYFELKVTVRTSTNGSYELRWNEVNVLSGSGVNSANVGSDGSDIVAWRTVASGANMRWDDMYVCDDAGAINNDFKGDSQIRGGLPNGVGDVQQWTPGTGTTHHTLVDDAATGVTDGTDNVNSDTNGQKDLFDFQDLVSVNGNIYGLMLMSQLAMNAAGSRTLKHVYRDIANVEYNPANFVVSSTTYTEFQDIMEVNPNTAVAWTESDINNAQFGVEVVS